MGSVTQQAVLRLPPGFRFHPTDEELVVQYLRRKALSFPLPASIIPDIDISKFTPRDLPGGLSTERYFFSRMEAKYAGRAAESGYWKVTGKESVIVSKGNMVVGMKRTLVFHYRGKRTNWMMHEYRLVGAREREWVLCRIYSKKRGGKAETPEFSESSCVTEDGDGSTDGEEASSGGKTS